MLLPVLTPVERRRRRRRRSWRPRVAVLVALAAAGLAAWHWWPAGSSSQAATSPPPAEVDRAPSVVRSVRVAAAAAAQAAQQVTAARLVVVRSQPKARLVPALTSRSAILIDGATGDVVFWLKPHARVPIASVTKIMTVLLALEKLKPHDIVTVAPLATRAPANSEGLKPHERVEAWKLLYASMLYSGNDSALALAIAVGGSRAGFLRLMNDRARTLELTDTHFNSVSGVIDEDNYSSAWDLAALSRLAMQNPRFRTIVGTKQKRVEWAAPTNWKVYVNHNRLLTQYPGADGVKTGWTTIARHTLVASARRGGTWLIGVTLGSKDSFTDMKRLLDLGFRLRGS